MTGLDYNRKKLADRIRNLRNQNRVSQEELSDVCGINKGTLCKLENAERDPSIITLYKIAKGLDISVPDILEPSGDFIKEPSDEELYLAVMKSMKKLDLSEQNFVLEMAARLVELRRK